MYLTELERSGCDIKRNVLFILLKFRKKLLYKNIWLAVPAKDDSLEDKQSEGMRCPLNSHKEGIKYDGFKIE